MTTFCLAYSLYVDCHLIKCFSHGISKISLHICTQINSPVKNRLSLTCSTFSVATPSVNIFIMEARFEWSLKPILLWMKLLGIKLDTSTQTSYWVYLMILITSCSVLLHNSLVNFVSLITNFSIFWGVKFSATSKVDLIYNSSARLVDLIFLVGIPVAFTFFTRMCGHWKNLWENLVQIQEEMNLSLHFHQRCRKHCYLALFLLALVNPNIIDLFHRS